MRQIIELNHTDLDRLKREGLVLSVGGVEIALTYYKRALRPSEMNAGKKERKLKYTRCPQCNKRVKRIGLYLHQRQAHGRK